MYEFGHDICRKACRVWQKPPMMFSGFANPAMTRRFAPERFSTHVIPSSTALTEHKFNPDVRDSEARTSMQYPASNGLKHCWCDVVPECKLFRSIIESFVRIGSIQFSGHNTGLAHSPKPVTLGTRATKIGM
jgi:hypothetical protein